MKQKSNVGNVLIWLLFFVVVITVYITQIKKKNQRINKAKYVTGTVVGISKVAKGEQYVDFTYTIDGHVYKGSESIKFCLECKEDCCYLGAKVKVRYEEGNPLNSDLVHQ